MLTAVYTRYVESICSKYKLHDRAMFHTSGSSLVWDNEKNQWNVKLSQTSQDSQSKTISISADFAVIAPGKRSLKG